MALVILTSIMCFRQNGIRSEFNNIERIFVIPKILINIGLSFNCLLN